MRVPRFLVSLSIGLFLFEAALLAEERAPALAQQSPPKQLLVYVGHTLRLQMTTKKPIKLAVNENPTVIHVQPAPDDPTVVLITGLMPGRSRLTLTDVDGKKEVCQLGK